MKKKNILAILAVFILSLSAVATTASAKSIGDDYSIAGIGLGWALVGIAIFGFVLGYMKILKSGTYKKLMPFLVAFLLLGIGLQFVSVDETSTATTANIVSSDSECCPFEVTGSAITSGTNYITTTTWDEDTLTLTVPLTVSDSSDGNLTGHKTGLNLTVEPMCSSATADDIETICFASDYLMKYGGEYALDEDSTGYNAIWTTTEGTEYYDDCVKVTADSSDYAQIDYTMVNGTSGSWVSELSQIGDSLTWYVTVSNQCYTETITINAIVVSYTA